MQFLAREDLKLMSFVFLSTHTCYMCPWPLKPGQFFLISKSEVHNCVSSNFWNIRMLENQSVVEEKWEMPGFSQFFLTIYCISVKREKMFQQPILVRVLICKVGWTPLI